MANGNGGNGNNNPSGKIVPFKDKVNNVRGLLDRMKDQLAMALPSHFKVDRFLRVALTAVQKEPKLLECYQPSFLGALVEAAQLGLEVNTNLGHAWLIPFWNSKNRRLDCQLIPGYKGLIKLSYQSGLVATIRAHIVRERDFFEYEEGLNPRLIHKPYRTPDGKADRGEMVATYAVARVRGVEEPLFRVLERAECERIRDKYSKAAERGPWVDNFEEMCMKTGTRRLLKWMPSDTEKNLVQRAVDLDERAEAGLAQEFGDVIDISPDEVSDAPAPAAASTEGGSEPQPAEKTPAPASPAGGQTKLDQLAASVEAKNAGKAP